MHLYWGYIGVMENKMETTIIGFRGLGFRALNLVDGTWSRRARS